MKILILDNYDSFTYNLVHLIEKYTEAPVDVFRNDEISLEKVNEYDKIVLSPGPGLPSEAGILLPLIKQFYKTKSILGVCLGHQAIGEAFGGKLVNLDTVLHGVSLPVYQVCEDILFKGLPATFLTGRYHSWVLDEDSLGKDFVVTAKGEDASVMALKHCKYDLRGVQFHPESVLTEYGEIILKNWLET